MLKKTYFPKHSENKMSDEGNVEKARQFYKEFKPTNLEFLLRSRYEWMNDYLDSKTEVYELGAGAGFSREFIKHPSLKLTDVTKRAWIDLEVDALDLSSFKDNSVDAFICSHMIHHLAYPTHFLKDCERVLKPGGTILIHEINTSFFIRFLLRLMRHEGWSYQRDVFDDSQPANVPEDPWSANCAIPEMLFKDKKRFESFFPNLKLEKNKLCECLIFPLSGGVISKRKTIQLPMFCLKLIDHLDRLLVRSFPSIFALGRKVVIRKLDPKLS